MMLQKYYNFFNLIRLLIYFNVSYDTSMLDGWYACSSHSSCNSFEEIMKNDQSFFVEIHQSLFQSRSFPATFFEFISPLIVKTVFRLSVPIMGLACAGGAICESNSLLPLFFHASLHNHREWLSAPRARLPPLLRVFLQQWEATRGSLSRSSCSLSPFSWKSSSSLLPLRPPEVHWEKSIRGPSGPLSTNPASTIGCISLNHVLLS